ncbi:TPA: polysaccharide biosynthesis tyrosine autokinase [Klebsiella pneumoniae]|nr:polysaccharide biosynthesis tyrosine autokinase [Klebsiella pneumoniae]
MSSIKSNKPINDSDELDLGRVIGEIFDHRKLIIAVTSLFTLIALIYALLATPIYQADALIQVEQKQGNAILSSLSQVFPDSQPQSAPEITLLQSRMILGKTVDDLNLQVKVEELFFPVIGQGLARLFNKTKNTIQVHKLFISPNMYDDNFITLTVKNDHQYSISGENIDFDGEIGRLIDKNGIRIQVDSINAEPGTRFLLTYTSRINAINYLRDSLLIADQGKDTGMLTISLLGSDPDLIKRVIDSISDNYLEQNIARQAAQDAKSLDFLNQQLPKVRTELNESEDKLNAYRRQKDSVDLSLEAKSVLDQIVNVDNQLNELTFKESEISQLYTQEHPTYKALMEKRKILQDERAKLNKRVSTMPETQQEVLRLSRDVESGRAVYMQLLNRQQELNIAKSSAIGNVRIIDNAVTQPKPVKPKKLIIIAIGLISGFAISLGVVFLRTFLRRGIESPEQLEDLGITVYASIPVAEVLSNRAKQPSKIRFKKEEDANYTYLATSHPTDLAIEAIRGLRTSLHFAMMEARNNILMISGASPNAGKTFVSSNLGGVIAQTGKKILFIDADLRKGYTHKIFNESNENGLSEYLSGKIKLEDTIKHLGSEGFDFISRGMAPPNPAELLMHRRFGELIKWVSQAYDMVIIDTPAILAVTDAAIIGNYVGTTLLVARFEQNTTKELEVSVKRFEQSGVAIKGCILNGVVKKASSYYGYGYAHYGYSYKDEK